MPGEMTALGTRRALGGSAGFALPVILRSRTKEAEQQRANARQQDSGGQPAPHAVPSRVHDAEDPSDEGQYTSRQIHVNTSKEGIGGEGSNRLEVDWARC